MGPNQNPGEQCPKCGSIKVIPIVYGMPGEELWEQADKGKIKLGGCTIDKKNPTHFCKDCGAEFKDDQNK